MKLSNAERAVLVAYAEKLPLWMKADDEPSRRLWTLMLAQTMRARIPGVEWGTKAQSPSHPQSKDSIAYEGAGHLWSFDVQLAKPDNTLELIADPDGTDIPGQYFIGVKPIDWIGDSTPPQEPEPQPEPTPTPDPTTLEARVAELERVLASMRDLLNRFADPNE